jgi:predicted transcriptional regulator of viral defense system
MSEVMMNARFRLATPEITAYFKSDFRKAFNRKDLEEILNDNRKEWMLRSEFSPGAFIDNLTESGILKRKDLRFLKHNYPVYTKDGKADIYDIVGKASEKGYFSHLSAVYLHEMTVQIPKTIYLTIEQPRLRENQTSKITQDDIDVSFAKESKLSNAIVKLMLNRRQWTIYQLFGSVHYHEQETNSLETFVHSDGVKLRRTSPERTLIDIAIRPEYSGGIEIVREAYQNAQSRISVNRLNAILKEMKTKYPYHQVIGFWMEISSNYTETQLGILNRVPQEYDFYLIHGHDKEQLKYNKKWRIYYPSYLDS